MSRHPDTVITARASLATLLSTGGTVFTDDLDIKLERATISLLWSMGSVTITKEDTIVLNGERSKDAIQSRCEQICSLITDPTTSDFDRTKLQERIAKLSGGVAVIKVGGSSEVEVGERKDLTMMLLTRRVPPSRTVSFPVVVSHCSRRHLLSPLLHLVLPIGLQPQPPLPTLTSDGQLRPKTSVCPSSAVPLHGQRAQS